MPEDHGTAMISPVRHKSLVVLQMGKRQLCVIGSEGNCEHPRLLCVRAHFRGGRPCRPNDTRHETDEKACALEAGE